LKDDECIRYHNAAQKQKKDYTKYLAEKRHVCVKDLIAKRREKQ